MEEIKKPDTDLDGPKEEIDLEEQEKRNKERRMLEYFRENEINLRVNADGENCFVIVELPNDNPEYVILKNINEDNDIRTISRDTLYDLNLYTKEKIVEKIFGNIEEIEKAVNAEELSELIFNKWGKLNELLSDDENEMGEKFLMDVMDALRVIKNCLDGKGGSEDIKHIIPVFSSPKKTSDFYSPKQLSDYIVALKNKVAELLGDQDQGEEKEENFETRVVKAKKELFENAGNKSKEELVQLISDVEKILDEEKEKGKGKLKDKISEIRDSEFGKEKFMDGSVVYLPADGEAIFIGDTHGDPDAAVSVIEQEKFIEAMERGEKNKYLVFLGDYVDRGSGDVENVEQVIALYEKYPDNVIPLRGNHEGEETTDKGFLISLLRKYGDEKLAGSLGKYETSKTTGKKTLNLDKDWIKKLHSTDNAVKELYERYNKLFEKLPGIVVCGN